MLVMSPAKAAPAVRFEATLYTFDGSTIARLPDKAGKQLASRGQVAAQATLNGHAFQTVVEPGWRVRPLGADRREADQSAMIRLAHAMSEPCGPWGARQG
jgi:hypothetical protein